MKTKMISLATAVTLLSGTGLLAMTSPQTPITPAFPNPHFERTAFSDSAEAGMMHRAYRILASGDHDYHGHRLAAMEQIKKAADLLGVDLHGDEGTHDRQFLSDDRLREARGLLKHVLNASEVKSQDRIAHHVQAAIDEIDHALADH